MQKTLHAVRGAVTIDNPDNEVREMKKVSGNLLDVLLKKNLIKLEDIVSIQITQTPDLTQINAASALRAARPHFGSIPLFCAQEPDIEGMLTGVIRVLVTYYGVNPGMPVYLGGAEKLRTDIAKGNH